MNDTLAIYKVGDIYEVWCGCDGDNIINAHIIGEGTSRDAAVGDAVAHLESEIEALQSPVGVIREKDIRAEVPA